MYFAIKCLLVGWEKTLVQGSVVPGRLTGDYFPLYVPFTTATPFSADNSEIEIELSMPQVFPKKVHDGSSDGRQIFPS